ncbi:MAG: ATP synthase F1 subunit delta [Ignavibacteriaceae bacterium]|jgi:F-type H+-transporting ATPase subunit delta
MTDYRVSYRYASSLLETAEEKNILETVAISIQLVKDVIKENPKLQRILENPVVRQHIKLSILEEIFKSKIDSDTMNFLRFVVQKNRENFLPGILENFMELYDEKLGIVNVIVKTVFEFDDEQKSLLKERLEKFLNKNARIGYSLDKNVVGGFVARIGDTVYDASLRHQLELLKKRFLSGGLSLN